MEKEIFLSIQERVIANHNKLGNAIKELFSSIAELNISKFNARRADCLSLLDDLENDLGRLPDHPEIDKMKENISNIRRNIG